MQWIKIKHSENFSYINKGFWNDPLRIFKYLRMQNEHGNISLKNDFNIGNFILKIISWNVGDNFYKMLQYLKEH